MTGNHAKSIDVIIDDIKMDAQEKMMKTKNGQPNQLLNQP